MKIQVVIPDWVDKVRGIHVLWSFYKGLRHLGLDVLMVSVSEAKPAKDTIMVCWGVYKNLFRNRRPFRDLQNKQRKCGGELIILERGFIKREQYYYVGWHDLNGRGFQPKKKRPQDRWDALGVKLKRWQWKGKKEALIIGQVPWDTSCQHVDFKVWVKETIKAWKKKFPEDVVVFRPHPLRPKAITTINLGAHAIDLDSPLKEALSRARRVVTFSSTVGVDATIAGVPTHVVDSMSMLYEHQHAVLRNRQPWANWIAYSQWTKEEIELGLPWLNLHPEVADVAS